MCTIRTRVTLAVCATMIGGCDTPNQKAARESFSPWVEDRGTLRSAPDEPSMWIERRQLFTRKTAATIIIHAQGREGRIEEWKHECIIWSSPEGIRSLDVQTMYYYGGETSQLTKERWYWCDDVNSDGIDDVLVLEWTSGAEQELLDGYSWGKWRSRDEPTALRIVLLQDEKGYIGDVLADDSWEWADIPNPAGVARHLESGALRCDSPVWEVRLNQASARLRN